MFELAALAGLFLAATAVVAALTVVWLVLKIVAWTILLPFRLLFRILMIPVWLALGVVGLGAGAVLLPLLLVAVGALVLVGAVTALLALFLPLMPFVLVGLLVWAFVRRRPAVA